MKTPSYNKNYVNDREDYFHQKINDILSKCAYVHLADWEKSELETIPGLVNEIRTIQRMRHELEHMNIDRENSAVLVQ